MTLMELNQTNEIFGILISIVLYSIVFLYANRKIKMDRRLSCVIWGAIIVRFFFSVGNLYLFPDFLPHAGSDTIVFERTGYYLATGLMDISTYSWDHYPRLIYFVYLIIGRSPLVIVTINGVASILAAIHVYKIIEILTKSSKKASIALSLFLFFPHNIIFSSIILRESLIIFFMTLSLLKFIAYTKSKKIKTAILSTLYLLLAATLHAGMLFLGIGYLLYIIRDKQVIRRFDRLKKPIVIILIITIFIGLYFYSDQAFRKIASYDSIDSIVNQVNRTSDNAGGSAYLTSFKVNNLFDMVLFLPIRIIYLMFSPMVWDIRNINDIIAFTLDSVFYIYMIARISKQILKADFKHENNTVFLSLLIGLIASVSVFALGTSNAGTALRHRFKVLPLMMLMINYPIATKKQKRKKESTN